MIARGLVAIAVVLLGSLTGSQTAGPAGSIEGQVVNLATRAPVPGATVSLSLGTPRIDRRSVAARPSFPAVKSDEHGHFAFRGLDAGIYGLFAERDGFLGAAYRSIGSSQAVLGENQSLSGKVLGLMPDAVVAVKVRDSLGKLLTWAAVRLLHRGIRLGMNLPQLTFAGSCNTDDLGECRIAHMAPGEYLLEAGPPPRPTSSYGQPKATGPQLADVTTYYPDAVSPAEASPFRIGPGETRVEIELVRVATVQIGGRVIDPTPGAGTPIVHLIARNTAGTSVQVESPPGGDGSFLIRNVPPGSYYFAVTKSAPVPSEIRSVGGSEVRMYSIGSMSDIPPVSAAAFRPIEVGRSNLDSVDLKMEPTFDVGIGVAVEQGAQCWPRGGMDPRDPSVFLFPEISMAARSHSTTLPGYAVVIKNVAPMRYFVNVPFAGRCYVRSIRYGGREAEDNLVEISRGGTLELTFGPGARVSGTVVDSNGRTATRAVLTLIPDNGPDWHARSTMVISGGSFGFVGVRPGAYKLFAWEDSMDTLPSPEMLKTFEKRAVPLTLTADGPQEPVRIEAIPVSESGKVSNPVSAAPPVRARGGIGGRVLDAVTGAPVKSVALNLKGWGDATPQSSAATDEQGRFEFLLLEPGFYNISTEHPNFAAATTALSETPYGAILVGEGQQVLGVELKLQPRR